MVTWSAICAVGTGLLVYFIMQSRMEVLLSKQREALAEARALLAAQKDALQDSLRNVEEAARRKAMDEFLADIHIEERHYTREHKLLFVNRKSLIRQERIFFRNIPLSNWVEQELPIHEGVDIEELARATSVFVGEALLGPEEVPVRRLLR